MSRTSILTGRIALVLLYLIFHHGISSASSQPDSSAVRATFHLQETMIEQAHNNFPSPYIGKNSLLPDEPPALSVTSTFYLGLVLPEQLEIHFNPELSGGKGLSGAVGIASFPNGDAFRVGKPAPQLSMGELYVQKTFKFDGRPGSHFPSRLQFILGKFSIVDFFDRNDYSDDARTQFMNWAFMNNGAWDYPADTRGYIPGFVSEYENQTFALRFAATMQTSSANGPNFDSDIGKAHSFALEGRYAYHVADRDGKIRLLIYYNTGHFGSYSEATNNPIYDHNVALTRQYGRTKVGFGINFQQSLSSNAGLFMRLGFNDGQNETWSYTEIDRTISAGILTRPVFFGREDDALGAAIAVNWLSDDHQAYLEGGGYGFIIGDGKLPIYGPESLLETYYLFQVNSLLGLTADYQLVLNPGYNPQRGPVNVFSIRAHVRL